MLLLLTFASDLLVRAHLAYFDSAGGLVTTRPAILRRFLRSPTTWVDLAATVPWAQLAWAWAGLDGSGALHAQRLGLLLLAHCLRLYRVPQLLGELEHDLSVSRFVPVLLRNLFFLLLDVHLAACAMFYAARLGGFDPDTTWVGSNWDRFQGRSNPAK